MARPIASSFPEPEHDPKQEPREASLPVATLGQQYARQHITEGWQPKGFSRYRQQKALLDEMNVLGGGSSETGGANPDRYRGVPSTLEEDFPVR